jgi:nucleolar protein 4
VRTVALGNLTPDTAAAALAAARGAGAVVAVEHPASAAAVDRAKLARDGCSGEVAFIEYDSVKAAVAAVARLHGATVAPRGGAAKPKPSAKAAAAAAAATPSTVLWARQVSGEGALLKRWRVIVRNLAFSVDAPALRAALAPAGFVWELNIPRRPDGTPRGFAFAGFVCRAAAERAIKAVNGLELGGRVVAVDWAVGKAAFDKAGGEGGEEAAKAEPAVAEPAAKPGAAAAPAPSDDEDDQDPAEVDVGAERSLLASVVAGLEPEEKSRPAKKVAPKKASKAVRAATADAEADADATKARADRAAAAAAKLESNVRATARALAARGAGVAGTTFVRGLPPAATAGDVRARFEAFGDVMACRLVVDAATGRSKGTAFVEFADAASAARAAAASDAAASGDGRPLTVAGADVRAAVALSKDGARALGEARGGKPGGAAGDARNLYLAKEGRIEPGSSAWSGLSPTDRVHRAKAAAEAKSKLASPNFCVSKTRLCLRNLPFATDEAGLKKLLLDAVTARATQAQPKLTQVKVITGARRPGAPVKSKGLAFAEFADHEHALCALRELNNSPTPFGADRRPIVEFAIDDARALQKRAGKRENAIARRDEKEGGTATVRCGEPKPDAGPEPAAKRVRPSRSGKSGEKRGEKAAAARAGAGAREPAPAPAPAPGATEPAAKRSGRRAREAAAAERKKRKAGAGDGGDAPPAKRAAPAAAPAARPARAGKPAPAERAAPTARAPATPARPRARAPAPRAPAPRAARGADKRDTLDDLVDRYTAKLFSSEGAGAGLQGWV